MTELKNKKIILLDEIFKMLHLIDVEQEDISIIDLLENGLEAFQDRLKEQLLELKED